MKWFSISALLECALHNTCARKTQKERKTERKKDRKKQKEKQKRKQEGSERSKESQTNRKKREDHAYHILLMFIIDLPKKFDMHWFIAITFGFPYRNVQVELYSGAVRLVFIDLLIEDSIGDSVEGRSSIIVHENVCLSTVRGGEEERVCE